MKKTIAILLVLLTALMLPSGCAAKKEAPADDAAAADTASYKTLGDVLGFEEDCQEAYTETAYVYVFKKDGVYYRATAEMPADVSDNLWNLDFFADDHDEQVKALVSPLEITKFENLSEQIPTQEELDKLIGKTGQELKDEGWYISGWNLDDLEFWMYYGPFAYTVNMEGDFVPNENYDFDEDADFAPLTVKSVTFNGLGDASGLD